MIEQLKLFGPTEGAKPIKRTKSRQEQIEDYEGFLEKFAVKKTTDDCYTPEPVYQAVIDFVRTLTPLDGRTIVRPFYPGGDYETYEYPANCIVIDNPPFSILAKILKFYDLHGVPFFLFAPALTLFSPNIDATFIISDVTITYENGAKVPTGFITNVIPDLRLWCCPEIGDAIERAQAAPPSTKKPFVYPDNIVTAATLRKIPAHGVSLKIPKTACRFIRDSESAVRAGRGLFGGGYLLSDRAAAERAAAERRGATVLELSPMERLMVEELNKCY